MPIKIILESGEILRATTIQWTDSKEEVRAAFSVSKNSGPLLMFFDKEGKTRLSVGLNNDERLGIDMYNDAGQCLVSLVTAQESVWGIMLHDADGNRAVEMSVDNQGERRIGVWRSTGEYQSILS